MSQQTILLFQRVNLYLLFSEIKLGFRLVNMVNIHDQNKRQAI